MKKITFFLCALFISAMSFAGEATLSFANKAQRTSFSTSTQVWVQNGITVTNNKSNSTTNVADYANPARFYKSSELIVECSEGNITKIVFDCNSPSYATVMQTSIGAAATASSDKVTVILDGSSTSFAVSSLGGQVRMDAITVTYAAGEGEVNAPSIPISQNFLGSLEITMTLVGEGDIYYTLDGTDPTTTSTKYTAPFTITETTTVKAIAENGGKASSIATATYTKVEPLTTMDAIFAKATAADQQVFVTFNNWIVTGVKNSNAYVTDGTKGLIIYQSGHGLVVGDVLSGTIECTLVLYKGSAELKGVTSNTSGLIVTEGGEAPVNELNEESIAALGGVHTGSVIKISGEVTTSSSKYYINGVQLYNSLFEFGTLEEGEQYDCIGVYCQFDTTKEVMPRSAEDLVKIETGEPLIKAEDLTFDAIALGDEVEAQTLTVTGANLTADIAVTLDNEKFTVTPATLPAKGGDLTITPAADLTAGEHTAILTLTSGEATAEVTLTIVAKDVYTITWSVNGETTTTTVVEGDNLVLPATPEAPEACSEKVFVGWTAAEEVNADGSDIEWVTAATAPTAAATYYAVFALQEGEGGAIETSVSVNIGEYASANSWTNQTQYLSMSIDENITATITEEGTNHNSGKYYDNGTNWRIYQNESPTLTIAAAEGITISTVAVTYSVNNTGVLTLGGANVESGAVCEINAASVTFGVGNTGSATNGQVRITDIKVVYTSGAPATYTDYSTTCEPEIPTVTLSCTDMDKMYMAMRDMLQLEGTSTNDEYVTVALYNYAATVGDYQAYIAFGDLELETESLTINRGSEEWTLTATIDADTAIYEFTATTAAPKTETIAPRAATWGGDAMNGYIIDCTTTIGNVQISVMDGTEYGMGWMLNMAINDALVVEGATIDAPTWEEDNLVLDVTVVSGTLDEYTIQLTATPKPATEIIANATMALSEDENEVGTMIVSATWEEHPLTVKLNGWPYYGYGEYAEAHLIIDDVVDAYSTATLEKKEDVAVLTGTFSDWNGNKYALTLTIAEPAAAPVVETVNVVCTDMVQGEEWGTPVLTGTCDLGDINISLYLDDTDHPESVYGEYGFAEYPTGLFPAVEVTIEGEDSFIMLELMENTIAVYTDGETQDSFVGTFLGSDWKVYVLDMKTPNPEGPAGLDNVTTTVAPVKAIVNGQLVIVKDGVQYNAQGAVVK